MNLEELKLILDTVNGLGGTAAEVVMWYFALLILQYLVIAVGILIAIPLLGATIAKLIGIIDGSSEASMARWASQLGILTYGSLTHSERAATVRRINGLVAEFVADRNRKDKPNA